MHALADEDRSGADQIAAVDVRGGDDEAGEDVRGEDDEADIDDEDSGGDCASGANEMIASSNDAESSSGLQHSLESQKNGVPSGQIQQAYDEGVLLNDWFDQSNLWETFDEQLKYEIFNISALHPTIKQAWMWGALSFLKCAYSGCKFPHQLVIFQTTSVPSHCCMACSKALHSWCGETAYDASGAEVEDKMLCGTRSCGSKKWPGSALKYGGPKR